MNLKFRSTGVKFWDKSQSLNLIFFVKKNKKNEFWKKKIFWTFSKKNKNFESQISLYEA